MSAVTPGVQTPSGQTPGSKTQAEQPDRWREALHRIASGSALMSILAVLVAMVVGALLIGFTNQTVLDSMGYLFARPGDAFTAFGNAVGGAFASMFRGAFLDYSAKDFLGAIQPLASTFGFATPLVFAGLGIGVAFRAGLFNIGGQGQMLAAASLAGWVGFSITLPFGVHLVVALLVGALAGGVWAAIAGVLTAKMNAHEVIVTIMLNYIMFYLMSYLLRTQGALQAPGSSQPKTAPIKSTAILPNLFGASFPVNLGIVLAVAAALGCWWLLERSTFGFQIRAVGLNQRAAKTAGMSTAKVTIGVMTLAGALVGLAGAYQVLGAVTTGFGSDIDDNVGFDAITVALLGRSRPWGVFWSGLLFGAFKAGGFAMQAANGVSIDIVLVVQSLIVLFIAAPPLIRALFHLPQLGRPARRVRATEVTA